VNPEILNPKAIAIDGEEEVLVVEEDLDVEEGVFPSTFLYPYPNTNRIC